MADRPGQETAFCHECFRRWTRESSELVCPNCESEFVEILDEEPERNDRPDPRRERSPTGFPDFLPSVIRPLIHEHDEVANGNVTQHRYRSNDGRFQYTATTFRSSPGYSPRQQQSPRASPAGHEFHEQGDPLGPVFHNFNSILQGIAGGGEPLPRASPYLQQHRQGNSYSQPDGFGVRDSGDGQWGQQPGASTGMNQYPFDAMFQDPQNLRENQARYWGHQQPPPHAQSGAHPVAAILAQLFGMTRHGDAVYSQEEFDRVMSQLMAQNNASAPGPASEEAIRSLPKKAMDRSMLGDDGKAECSICMDHVGLGSEVTVLPCEHWFHDACVKSWLSEHDTCPHCRRGITEPQPSTGENQQQQNPNPSAPAPGSRHNPYVVNDSPPQSSSSSGHPGPSNGGRWPHNPRPHHGFGGWMRSHFGGSGSSS